MLEKFIKKDRNEILESVLDQKDVDEKTKNLLQGILYKIDVSYKDYQKAKVIQKNKKEYVDEINKNIKRKCNKIVTISFNAKIENDKIKQSLEKNKFYLDDTQIITYPIEEKLLYAIEKSINNNKIINNKYDMISKPLSNLMMTGKCLDRVEVLRDFNGWSWTTIKQEVENIKANLVYQALQILVGEEFLDSWTLDIDGIIDYYKLFLENLKQTFNDEIACKIENSIQKISIINAIEEIDEFKEEKIQKYSQIQKKSQLIENVEEYVDMLTNEKKLAEKEIAQIQKKLSSEKSIKEEYQKVNDGVPLEKKVFSVRVLRQNLNHQQQALFNTIDDINTKLKPNNYSIIKNDIAKEKNLLEVIYYTEEERENIYLEFVSTFLDCFEEKIQQMEKEKIIEWIYRFRYFLLLPFNKEQSIKNIDEVHDKILEIEKELMKICKKNKIIKNDVPLEVWTHIFETRIIELENICYKIFTEYDKKYVQLFDENISEEKYIINNIEKNKINKKVKIFL